MAEYQEMVINEYAQQFARNWFKIDEGSGTVLNDSKGNATGTISGATWTLDNGLYFDGVDDIVNTNIKTPSGDLSFYFEYQSAATPSTTIQTLYNDASNGAGNYEKGIWLFISGQRVIFRLLNASNSTLLEEVFNTPNILDGQKHYILFTWNKITGAVKVFYDDLQNPVRTFYTTQNYDPNLAYNPSIGRTRLSSAYYYTLKGNLSSFMVFEEDLSELNLNKSFILHEGNYKNYDVSFNSISSSLPTIEQFISLGMNSLSPLLDRVNGYSPLDDLEGDFEIVTWTDEINSARNLELSVSQEPQLVYPTSDISLAGVESVDNINLTAAGDAKIAVSFDSGLTWSAFRNGVWEIVEDAFNGMTINELNSLTNEQISLGRGDSNFIRFSYSLSGDAEIDKIEIQVTLQGTERILPTDSYDLDYDYQNKTIIYTLNRDMTLSINYVDGQ